MAKKKRAVLSPSRPILLLALCLVLVPFLAGDNYLPAPAAARDGGPTASLLVCLAPGTTAAERAALLAPLQARVVGQIPQLELWALSVPAARAAEGLAALNREPAVLYAEANARATASLWPDDPGWPLQWGPQKIGAPLAWDVTRGRAATVIAVVDSGVTLGHEDLAGRLWSNPGEIPANGADDDGNGKVDDVWGWHFFHAWDGQAFVPGENNQVADDYGHGSHVAGIAGAGTDNGLGIAGLAGEGRLMAVKVLDEYGLGWYFDIARGIVYAVDNGAAVVNLSLGGETPSQALQDAVDYARDQDAVVVAASGNDGGPVFYPAACRGALAVAATDRDDGRAAFSNYGPPVDVAAPGVEIYSTWPWVGGYATKSGTSMATPHVSGVAALLLALQPEAGPLQVTQAITTTAADVDAPGRDPYTGWGRIDAYGALLGLLRAGLDLDLAVAPEVQVPGGPLTYTLALSNAGPVRAGLVLSDTLPDGVAFVGASPPGNYDPARHEVVWQPLTLTAGARLTLSLAVSIEQDTAPWTWLADEAHLLHDGTPFLTARVVHRVGGTGQIYLPLLYKHGGPG